METRADSIVNATQNAATAIRGMAVVVAFAMVAVIATLLVTLSTRKA